MLNWGEMPVDRLKYFEGKVILKPEDEIKCSLLVPIPRDPELRNKIEN